MKRTTMMLPEDLVAQVRERVGGQGLSPLVRDLLTSWIAAGDPPARHDTADAYRRLRSGPAPQSVGGRGPRPKADRPRPSPDRVRQAQGPTCRRCGSLASMRGGKPVCMQKGCK